MSPALFKTGERVQHGVSGGIYRIVDLPTRCRIATTGQPAYTYALADPKGDITLWVRSQQEMEDGRFQPITSGEKA